MPPTANYKVPTLAEANLCIYHAAVHVSGRHPQAAKGDTKICLPRSSPIKDKDPAAQYVVNR